VVEISTRLTSQQLLEKIKAVETILNLQPKLNKGPRMVDLDILLFNDERSDDEQLRLPHPAICRRKFVLVPLLEIEPQAYCHVDRRPYQKCLTRLADPSQQVEVYHG
jgi:2-amino-4-hydroxy-6-hydroxymethyldihydropteridine diphosphokinase